MFDILAPNVKLYMALPVVIGSLLPHPHLTFYSPMSMFLFLCSASILFFHHFIEVTNEGNWHLNSPRMVKQNFPICTIVVQLAVSDIFLMSNCMFLLVDPILLLLKIGIDSYTSSIFPGRWNILSMIIWWCNIFLSAVVYILMVTTKRASLILVVLSPWK